MRLGTITGCGTHHSLRGVAVIPTRRSFFLSLANLLVMVALGSLLAFSLQAQGQGRGGGKSSGWKDKFNSGRLDTRRWNISSGWAPGYRPNNHIGYYEPENVNLQNGYLVLRLWQEPGEVDGNREGAISHGAQVTTKQKYGYGTYEWRMRMSSTATSPSDWGESVSGSVSAGLIYVNNSQTEIDFGFGGHLPKTLYMLNWHNPDPSTGPFDDQVTFDTELIPGLNSDFFTFKFVWKPRKISFYVNGERKVVHTTNVPSAPAYFIINHRGTNSDLGTFGGPATLGVDRYFYIDWVRFTPFKKDKCSRKQRCQGTYKGHAGCQCTFE